MTRHYGERYSRCADNASRRVGTSCEMRTSTVHTWQHRMAAVVLMAAVLSPGARADTSTAVITAVGTTSEMASAMASGAAHIVVTEHLDLTALATEEEGLTMVHFNDPSPLVSIQVRLYA